MSKIIDLTGERFGRLTVIMRVENEKRGRARWLCQCDCGDTSIIVGYSLRNGDSKSCGCYGKQYHIKHGKIKHDLYWVYQNMKKRCSNKTHPQYKFYGGRGIMVCELWKDDFMSFFAWAIKHGWRKGLDIDRENNDFGYFPENCRFISHQKNLQNSKRSKKWAVNGEIYNSLSEAAKHLNVCPTTIRLWCDGGKNNGKIVESRDNCFSYKKYTSRSL